MISVVIPVKDGGADLERCLAGIATQQVDEEVEVVVVDSGSTDGSPDRARAAGARVHEIPAEEFGHGRTRNLGVELARGDLVVFTCAGRSMPHDDAWLARLAAAARSDADVGGAYGRQLPHEDARPPERFFLDFLYGPDVRVQRLGPDEELTFESTLFSNVNAAIPRPPPASGSRSADDLTMSEDQEWSRRVLRGGYALVYEPARGGPPLARVHDPNGLPPLLRLRRVRASTPTSRATSRARPSAVRAARYAREELAWLWRSGQRRWIPYTAVYELGKFAGLQLGLRHERLPRSVVRRLGSYDTG